MLKVKVFASSNHHMLEHEMNEWLSQETEGSTIEIAAIEYSIGSDCGYGENYSALIFYEEKETNEQTS